MAHPYAVCVSLVSEGHLPAGGEIEPSDMEAFNAQEILNPEIILMKAEFFRVALIGVAAEFSLSLDARMVENAIVHVGI